MGFEGSAEAVDVAYIVTARPGDVIDVSLE